MGKDNSFVLYQIYTECPLGVFLGPALYKLHRFCQSSKNFSHGQLLCDKAKSAWLAEAEGNFTNVAVVFQVTAWVIEVPTLNSALFVGFQLALKYLDLKNLKGHRISFLCGDAGPIAIATVISYKLGTKRPENLPDFEALSQRLLDLNRLMKKSPDELLYGAAGYLYSLLFVKSNIGENIIPSKNIEKVIDHILTSGKLFSAQVKSNSPLLWQWHDKIYLGAAHGVGGILYLLLQARSYINQQDIETLIKPTLDWLAHKQLPSGNFPSSLGSSSGDRLVQWCHGAPGFVHLFVLAHQIFKDDKYLQIAIKCGNVIWERGLCTKGYSICHGVSGNAYSFICLYQATKDPLYLFRACCFMDWCVKARPGTEQHMPDRPASLFEGLLGRLYLAEDIARPEDANFPAFTLY